MEPIFIVVFVACVAVCLHDGKRSALFAQF